MQASTGQSAALDQLQSEINLILEHTGRFFASIGKPGEQAARAARLKQQVATSGNRFHEALDTLDEQLEVAKAVMRRDLAVAREREGKQPEARTVETAASKPSEQMKVSTAEVNAEDPKPTEPASQPAKTAPVQTPISPEATPIKSPRKRPSTHGEDSSSDEPAAKKQALGEEKPSSLKNEAAGSQLQVDTNAPAPEQTEAQQAEDQVPDTGTFSNNADLDSLFDDQASAGGTGAADSGENAGFNTDDNDNTNADFDFGTITASLENNDGENANDNADVSALLPGLQDYANDNDVGEHDFSSFFANDQADAGDGQVQMPEAGGNDGGIFDDLIFDNNDFMNVKFDMGGGDGNNEDSAEDFFKFD